MVDVCVQRVHLGVPVDVCVHYGVHVVVNWVDQPAGDLACCDRQQVDLVSVRYTCLKIACTFQQDNVTDRNKPRSETI